MSANSYEDLLKHDGHEIVCVTYGEEGKDPENVAVECQTCYEILLDFNKPETDVNP